MAKTAVVNRRRRRSTKRRRNYNALAGAATANPRRRRRRKRTYGSARRRRRNPASPYATEGYRRRPNPSGWGRSLMSPVKHLFDVLPAGTAGILGARLALKHSGPWSGAPNPSGAGQILQPGLMQAAAIWLGAQLTGELIGKVFRSPAKGQYAKIAGLAFGGDLFLRTRFLRDSSWYGQNLSLAGMDEEEMYDDDDDGEEYFDEGLVNGFQSSSELGEIFTDSDGVTWGSGPDGNWTPLSGMGAGEMIVADDGTLYQLQGMGLDSGPGAGARLAGFQTRSALGAIRANPNASSSFGYSP